MLSAKKSYHELELIFWRPRMVRYMDKVFKNGPSKICGIQPLKDLKGYGLQSYHFNFF